MSVSVCWQFIVNHFSIIVNFKEKNNGKYLVHIKILKLALTNNFKHASLHYPLAYSILKNPTGKSKQNLE